MYYVCKKSLGVQLDLCLFFQEKENPLLLLPFSTPVFFFGYGSLCCWDAKSADIWKLSWFPTSSRKPHFSAAAASSFSPSMPILCTHWYKIKFWVQVVQNLIPNGLESQKEKFWTPRNTVSKNSLLGKLVNDQKVYNATVCNFKVDQWKIVI